MKLGIDAANLRAGGGQTHLIELLRVADPEKHGFSKVIVWGGRKILSLLPQKPWLVLSHQPLLDKNLLLRTFWQKRILPSLAKQHCDILFAPGGNYLGSFRPCVTMSRNLLPFQFNEMCRYGFSAMFIRMLILRYLQTKSIKHADGVIYLSQYAKKIVEKVVGTIDGKRTTIAHGINHQMKKAPREQKHISEYSTNKPFRFFYASTIDVYKHQDKVAEAIALLVKEGFPIELNLIGTATQKQLKKWQKLQQKLDPQNCYIHYLGNVAYDKMPQYYFDSDMFIFASSCETFSNILLESMIAGLPVACSHRSVMPELLQQATVYFDPEKPEDIAKALRTLLLDPNLRQEIALQSYNLAQMYSWEKCAAETFGFLADIRHAKNCDTGR